MGALTGAAAGTALPVVVTVNGAASGSDKTFVVNAGKMYYVSNVSGSDSTGVAGDSTHPYRYVQGGTIWNSLIKPGDTIVMRGTGTPWVDAGSSSRFLLFNKTDGSAPKGTSGGPYTVLGHPNEDVFINYTSTVSSSKGAISGYDTTSPSGYNGFFTVAGLHVEGGGTDGPINLQEGAYHWRVVNNELTATTTHTGLAGGVAGDGAFVFILGNHVHDVTCSGCETNHGVYIDGDAVGFPSSGQVTGFDEIGYNWIENISGGSGIQLYDDQGANATLSNVVVHHNIVHNVLKYLILLGGGQGSGVSTGDNIVVYDNVAYNGGIAGFYFDGRNLGANQPCLIFNNTIYSGLFDVNTSSPPNGVIMENNILYQPSGQQAVTAFSGETFTSNLSGVVGDSNQSKTFSSVPGTGSIATGTWLTSSNFQLASGSPAIAKGANGWKSSTFPSIPVFTFTDSVTSETYAYYLNSNFASYPITSTYDIGAL